MSTENDDAQARIYRDDAVAYDALISAEDADGELVKALGDVPFDGAQVADIGAGTARLTRLLCAESAHVDLIDRAGPMLEVGRARLAGRTNFAIHEADARALPLKDARYDVAMAGWVFGHFRHWMPEGWRDEVRSALSEMRRVLKPGGALIVIETLGTGHTTPRTHAALDEYFALLEAEGLTRTWVRTDYVFDDVERAASITGRFFGDAFAARVRSEGWSRVPECTGIWRTTR